MPFIDELPAASAVSTTDLLTLCQGSSGAAGSGTDRKATVAQLVAKAVGPAGPAGPAGPTGPAGSIGGGGALVASTGTFSAGISATSGTFSAGITAVGNISGNFGSFPNGLSTKAGAFTAGITCVGLVSTGDVNFGAHFLVAGQVALSGPITGPSASFTNGIASGNGLAVTQTATIDSTNGLGLSAYEHRGAPNGTSLQVRVDRTDGFLEVFLFGASTAVGSITTNGSTTAFNVASDYRLKNTFGLADVGDCIDAVKVYDGEYKALPHVRRVMMLAHELAVECPWVVTGERDAVNEDGSIRPQQVSYADLVPVLWSACQALRASVAALTARVAVLEAPKP
jgi:hypothetical protein